MVAFWNWMASFWSSPDWRITSLYRTWLSLRLIFSSLCHSCDRLHRKNKKIHAVELTSGAGDYSRFIRVIDRLSETILLSPLSRSVCVRHVCAETGNNAPTRFPGFLEENPFLGAKLLASMRAKSLDKIRIWSAEDDEYAGLDARPSDAHHVSFGINERRSMLTVYRPPASHNVWCASVTLAG